MIDTKTHPILSPQAGYGYIPGLDGIRAISVLIVILAHMGLEHLIPGGFGVTVFFFISGFLITRLLIAEREAKGRIGLKQFYIRRFIRLYPALLLMVICTSIAYLALGWGGPTLIELLSAVFYGTNIFQVVTRMGGELPFMPWTHLWSLAVEEHFYLIFPAFLVLLGGNWKRILWGLGVVLFAALLWRVVIYTQTALPVQDYTYMMTDTRIDSLVWGCFLSVLLHVLGDASRLKRLMGWVPIGAALVAILASFLIRDESFRYTARFTLQGMALFVLFLNLFFWDKVRWVISILEWKPLAWFGVVSYALYLWHVPIIDMCVRTMGDTTLAHLIAFPISVYFAAVSYYLVEKRFLALRKKFGSHGITKTEPAASGLAKDPKAAAIARVLGKRS
ncbi:acyltransferase family protein [Litorimonas sp. RW-G-Af-16]|uniref:acyltransferase family protein n=1 Tax=Litorimonas sp. RW-G-Af-16 TaxID=3241168 RepID=UPI00390C442D